MSVLDVETDTDSDEEEFQSVFDKWKIKETEKIGMRFAGKKLSVYTKRYLNYQRKHVNKLMVFGSPFSSHVFLVKKKDNKLYAFGKNMHGQLGITNVNQYKWITKVNVPTLVVDINFRGKRIKKVCCGDSFSIIHLVDRTLLVCGSNKYGQIGTGKKYREHLGGASFPVKLSVKDENENVVKIEDVFVGLYHTIFITENMEAYGCGLNDDAQLGVGYTLNLITARKITIKEKVFSATCGGNFTFFISVNGTIYGTGSSILLGIGEKKAHNIPITRVPTKIPSLSSLNLVQISCGYNHTVVLTGKNEVYSFGEYPPGALGVRPDRTEVGKAKEYVFNPKHVKELKGEKILSINCGDSHTLFNTKYFIFGTGSNHFGQLSIKDRTSVKLPIKFKLPFNYKNTNVQILALEHTTLFFTEKEVYGCGSGEYGNLLTLGPYPRSQKTIVKLINIKVKKSPKEEEMEERKERLELVTEEGKTLLDVI
jgi:alpha-tubulin suppressor-like RCC1 family protein